MPSGELALTAAVAPSLLGVKVQTTSLKTPWRHVTVVPSQVAVWFSVPNFERITTDVPLTFMTRVRSNVPQTNSVIDPLQVPAKRSFGFDGSFGLVASAGLLVSEVSTLFRFVFDDGFGASSCGAGVGFSSSTIGAGERCAIIKIDNKTKKKRNGRITLSWNLTAVKAAPYNIYRPRCIRTNRYVRPPKNAKRTTRDPI